MNILELIDDKDQYELVSSSWNLSVHDDIVEVPDIFMHVHMQLTTLNVIKLIEGITLIQCPIKLYLSYLPAPNE